MRVTVDALAAVAVAGAASAQVTLSGKYAFGYVSDKIGNAASVTGLETTDGHLTFKASEDLGGGLKAIASMEIKSRGRTTDSVAGRDASLALMGGFGTVSMGSVESGNPVNSYAGSDGRGLDSSKLSTLVGSGFTNYGDKVTLGAGDVDFLKYTSPQIIPGLTLSLSKADQVGAGAVNAGNTTRVSANYNAGMYGVDVDYTKFKEAFQLKNRTVIGGFYDFGVAKLSAGFQTTKDTAGSKLKETVLGVSAPVASNISVGLTYAKSKVDGGRNAKGYDLGTTYSLSKRTNVNFSYAAVTPATGAAKNKFTRVKLTHSF